MRPNRICLSLTCVAPSVSVPASGQMLFIASPCSVRNVPAGTSNARREYDFAYADLGTLREAEQAAHLTGNALRLELDAQRRGLGCAAAVQAFEVRSYFPSLVR